MPTKTDTTTTTNPPAAGPRPWQQPDWLPTTQAISWPALDEARGRHLAALEAVAAATTPTEQAKASDELYDAVEGAWQAVMTTVAEAEEGIREAREQLRPPLAPGQRLDPVAQEAERERVREGRGPIEDDERLIRGLALGTFVAAVFESQASTTLVPEPVAEVRRMREANA